jgi:LacI family transcriptional regulator
VTLRDVARRAGVSIATVSYVLNGRKDRLRGPGPEVTERVKRAVDDLGYRVNTSARTLRRLRSELVAIAYRPPVGPWLEELVKQTEDFGARRGYSLITVPVFRDDYADRSLQVISRGYVDGAILTFGSVPEAELDEVARGAGALMILDDERPTAPGYDIVRVGERRALAEATRFLFEQGRRRVAYYAYDDKPGLRYAGYADAVAEAGRDVDPSSVIVDGDPARATAALAELLAGDRRPDAIMCGSDRSALAALHLARELGLRIPAELAIIGVGNTGVAELSDPPLTSVGIPKLDFSPILRRLFERIDDPGLAGEELTLDWRLNLRLTT